MKFRKFFFAQEFVVGQGMQERKFYASSEKIRVLGIESPVLESDPGEMPPELGQNTEVTSSDGTSTNVTGKDLAGSKHPKQGCCQYSFHVCKL